MNTQSEAERITMNKHEEILSKYAYNTWHGSRLVSYSDALKAMRELEESLAARTEGDGWTKVEDWKPGNSKVLVAYKFGVMEASHYKGKFFKDLIDCVEIPGVTHVRPLPSPLKQLK
jgi:hypothetical protein